MHPKYNRTIDEISTWARENSGVRGLILIGSQARSTLPADQWSDLDLMVLVDDPQAWLDENTWLDRFGEVVCFFEEIVPLHFTSWRWCVKRVLYRDQRDVDFSLLPYLHLDEVLRVNQDILAKGYRVLYDANRPALEAKVCAVLEPLPQAALPRPTRQELQAIVNDLLYHVIWAMKKIKRHELWVATGCINCYMRGLLLRLIEMHNAVSQQAADPLNYSGRYLEQRTAPQVLALLEQAFTRYDPAQAVQTLQHLLDLTGTLAQAICQQQPFAFDGTQFSWIQAMFDELKAAG
jgi:aminoglycoside 6-adenylyltransferase